MGWGRARSPTLLVVRIPIPLDPGLIPEATAADRCILGSIPGPAPVGNLCLRMPLWGHRRAGCESRTPSSSDRLLPWETCFVWKNPGRQVCAAPSGPEAHAWHGWGPPYTQAHLGLIWDSEETRPAAEGPKGLQEGTRWSARTTQGFRGLWCGWSHGG